MQANHTLRPKSYWIFGAMPLQCAATILMPAIARAALSNMSPVVPLIGWLLTRKVTANELVPPGAMVSFKHWTVLVKRISLCYKRHVSAIQTHLNRIMSRAARGRSCGERLAHAAQVGVRSERAGGVCRPNFRYL